MVQILESIFDEVIVLPDNSIIVYKDNNYHVLETKTFIVDNIEFNLRKIQLVETDSSFYDLRDNMPTNGYSNIDEINLNLMNNKPCYIAENGRSMEDVESWLSMYVLAYNHMRTKDFIFNYACEMNFMDIADEVEFLCDEEVVPKIEMYLSTILDEDITLSKFIVEFINEFVNQPDQWLFFSTYLNEI